MEMRASSAAARRYSSSTSGWSAGLGQDAGDDATLPGHLEAPFDAQALDARFHRIPCDQPSRRSPAASPPKAQPGGQWPSGAVRVGTASAGMQRRSRSGSDLSNSARRRPGSAGLPAANRRGAWCRARSSWPATSDAWRSSAPPSDSRAPDPSARDIAPASCCTRSSECRFSIFSFLPSSRQTMWSAKTDFLTGTAGCGRSGWTGSLPTPASVL